MLSSVFLLLGSLALAGDLPDLPAADQEACAPAARGIACATELHGVPVVEHFVISEGIYWSWAIVPSAPKTCAEIRPAVDADLGRCRRASRYDAGPLADCRYPRDGALRTTWDFDPYARTCELAVVDRRLEAEVDAVRAARAALRVAGIW